MNPAGWDTHLVIAVDYDGTLTSRKDGSVDYTAISYVKQMRDMGCVVILWTSRYSKLLYEAIEECSKRGLSFDGINENPYRTSSQKISADIYIDDKANIHGNIDWECWLKYVRYKVDSGSFTLLERTRLRYDNTNPLQTLYISFTFLTLYLNQGNIITLP